MRQTSGPAGIERRVSRIFQRRGLLLALLIHLFVFIAAPTYTIKTASPPPPPVITIEHVYEPPDFQEKQKIVPQPPEPFEEEDEEDLPEDHGIKETVLEHSTWKPDMPPPLLHGATNFTRSYEIKPALIHPVKPEYPELARIGNVSGIVSVRVLIGTDGSVQDVIILDGPEIFHESVLRAVRRMRFKPAQVQDRPVEVWISMPFHFELDTAS